MTTPISESELKLLVYLHEHVRGFGRNHPIAPEQITRDLGIDPAALGKDGSYLEEHGLIGLDVVAHRNQRRLIDNLAIDAAYLTGIGEDYVRALEAQPTVGKKLTTKALGELGKAATEVAQKLLTEFMLAGMKHLFP